LRSRADKFKKDDERRAFVATMWSLYEQAIAAGKPLTSKDVQSIINLAETQVKTQGFIFTSVEPDYKARMRGADIISYYDPATGQWIEGAPSLDSAQPSPETTGAAQPTPTTTLPPPPGYDPGLWQRAIDAVDREDRNNFEVVRRAYQILLESQGASQR